MNRRQFLSSLLAAIGAVALRPLMPLLPVSSTFDSVAFDAFLSQPAPKVGWVVIGDQQLYDDLMEWYRSEA